MAFLARLIDLYSLVVLVAVILSWVPLDPADFFTTDVWTRRSLVTYYSLFGPRAESPRDRQRADEHLCPDEPDCSSLSV